MTIYVEDFQRMPAWVRETLLMLGDWRYSIVWHEYEFAK